MEPTAENPQSDHPGVVPDVVYLKFDSPEAVGTISLRRHYYGAEILVDGIDIGLVDLFHRSPRGSEASPDMVQRGSVALHCLRTDADGGDYQVRAYHHCKLSAGGTLVGKAVLQTTVIVEGDTICGGLRELDIGEQPWKP